MKLLSRFILALTASGLTATVASAQMTPDTINASAKVISFLTPAPSGAVTAAIVYDPANPASAAEASAMESALGRLNAGSAKLTPKKVPVSALGGMSGAKVAYVTAGLSAHHAKIAGAGKGVLTITGDRSCVAGGKCVVGIIGGGKTEILVSKAALGAAGVKFGSMFAMLAKEI